MENENNSGSSQPSEESNKILEDKVKIQREEITSLKAKIEKQEKQIKDLQRQQSSSGNQRNIGL